MCIHLRMSIEYELYGALHIMCIVLHYAHQAACPRGSHQFSLRLCFARLLSISELGAYCPQYVLIVFMYARFRSVRYVLQLCGHLSQSCILALVNSLCVLHYYECNQSVIIFSTSSISIYSQYQFSKYFISIDISSI